jgi:hypothetical protein
VPCLSYIGDFLNRFLSTTAWGDSGLHVNQVRVDLQESLGSIRGLPNPAWHITPPCYTKK